MIHFDWGLRPTSIFVIENQTQYQKRQTDAIHNMCFTTVRTILSYAMASSDWFTTVKSQLATYKICAYLNQSHTQLLRCEPIVYFIFSSIGNQALKTSCLPGQPTGPFIFLVLRYCIYHRFMSLRSQTIYLCVICMVTKLVNFLHAHNCLLNRHISFQIGLMS